MSLQDLLNKVGINSLYSEIGSFVRIYSQTTGISPGTGIWLSSIALTAKAVARIL